MMAQVWTFFGINFTMNQVLPKKGESLFEPSHIVLHSIRFKAWTLIRIEGPNPDGVEGQTLIRVSGFLILIKVWALNLD